MQDPYSAPAQSPEPPPRTWTPIPWHRAFGIVVVSAVGFGLGGLLIGLVLALGLPDYYRTVFPAVQAGAVDPLQVGLALGLIQGIATGIGVALVLILLQTWWRVRSLQLEILLEELAEIQAQLAEIHRRLNR